jgi:hypothetical protein
MNNIPIILLVSERSGSNLLRTLIGNHKEICAPVSPHLMAEFYAHRRYYGDLRIAENCCKILQDMIDIANHPYHNWKLKITAPQIAGSVTSVVTAVDRLYREKARQEGKKHYCSKGIDAFTFIDPFRTELDNVKFIHLVRDPRDHVASWMKRPINLLTPYDTILKWKAEQQTYIDAVTTRGLKSISIRYEDLIEDTPSAMTRVLTYIGVDIDPNCFKTDEGNEEARRNPYWENLSKPVMKNNKQKYKKELSDEDILIIESIAKNEMAFFGYSPTTKCDWTPAEDYSNRLVLLRRSRRSALSKSTEDKMPELQDKWEQIERIRKRRMEDWVNFNPDFNISKLRKQKGSQIRNRMKHLSYALLGSRLTTKLASKIK